MSRGDSSGKTHLDKISKMIKTNLDQQTIQKAKVLISRAKLLTGYCKWSCFLRIREVKTSDEGQYECQVSTAVKLSQVFSLKVVIPHVSPISNNYKMSL